MEDAFVLSVCYPARITYTFARSADSGHTQQTRAWSWEARLANITLARPAGDPRSGPASWYGQRFPGRGAPSAVIHL